jgi:hypothetical protein
MAEPFEVLDALVDGELVDPEALDRALAEPEGRRYLIDAWLLREAVQEESAVEVAAPPAAVVAPLRWQSLVVAAGIACVCLVGGYLVGVNLAQVGQRGASHPPPPIVTPAAPARPSSFPVPAPTRVIRLELDANWKDSSGN